MGFFDSVLDFGKSLVKPAIDGFTGGLGSTILGMGSSLFTNSLNQSNAEDASERSAAASREAAAFNAEQYAKRYQVTAKDMKAAGINPIMAASGGFSTGNAPTMSSAQSFQAAPVQDMSSSAKNYADMNRSVDEAKKVIVETEKTLQDVKKSMAETENVLQDTLKKREETGLATAKERETVQNIINLQQQLLESAERVNLLKQQTYETATRAGLNDAQRWQAISNSVKIEEETKNVLKQGKILQAEVTRLREVDHIYNENPAGPALAIYREVLRALLGR